MKINVLGVDFDQVTLPQAVEVGSVLLRSAGFSYVVTPNPEFVLMAEQDEAFRTVLNGARLTIPDGIGVVYASRILGTPLVSRVPGIDFASGMLAVLNEMGGRLFLLGAKPTVAETAGNKLSEQYPNIVICGTHDGYFKDDAPVVEEIAKTCPDMIFVCLGAPRQEKWLAEFGPQTGAKLGIGLGGALDVFAGNVERAPEVWQKMGLEWAYRLTKEPSRIGRMARLPLILTKATGVRMRGKKA